MTTRRERWILLLICVWAFALRAWFASAGLAPGRFYDERFNVENIHRIVTSGSPAPANGYYQALSYLPHAPFAWASEKLYQATGWEPLRVIYRSDLTPTGYLLLRWLQALIGTATVAMTFVIGRRIFDPRTALLGAFLLAAIPWHVWQSSAFKPDIVMLLAATVAFYATLRALSSERRRDFLLAGVAIGLTVGAKLNGALIALPLVLGVGLRTLSYRAASSRKLGRHLGGLAVAGLSSVVTFFLLHPLMLLRPDFYRRDLSVTARDYERKGRLDETDHLDVLGSSVEWLRDEVFHGPLLGMALLVAIVALAVSTLRSGSARGWTTTLPDRDLFRLLLLGFPPLYALCYSALTTNLRAWHNWMILTPFTSLILAWMLVGLWRQVLARRPGWRPAARALALIAILAIAWPVHALIYTWRVPPTYETAQTWLQLALRDLNGRVIYQEEDLPRLQVRNGADYAAIARVETLSALSPQQLELADAELFTAGRLEGDAAAFYRQRWDGADEPRRTVVRPRWFSLRGPELRLLLRPWRALRPPQSLILKRQPNDATLYRGIVPPELRPQALSVSLWLPNEVPIGQTRFLSGRQVQPLHFLRLAGPNTLYQTPRFRLQPKAIYLSVRVDRRFDDLPEIVCGVFTWGRDEPGRVAGAAGTGGR